MAIVKWSPVDVFDDMDRMMSDWMPIRGMRMMTPAVDVYEDKDHVIVESPMPGIDPKQVSIEIEDNVLRISGQTESKTEVDDKNYYRKEVRSGAFSRAVALPKAVKGAEAQATYKDGVLKISIPKTEAAKPRKIEVKTE